MRNQFVSYEYPLRDVLPTPEQADAYLHIDDPEHPAHSFMLTKMEELRNANLAAVGGYRILAVDHLNIRQGEMRIGGMTLFMDRQVCGYMRGATHVALFLCTAGAVFSTQYRDYSKAGDYLEAFITDALGSLTVEKAMDRVQSALQKDMQAASLGISNRYSPGYCNWPLTGQQDLFLLAGSNPTGISLSESCLMYPAKSVSGIIGIGPQMKRREYGCAICSNKNCIYRRIVQNDK